MKRKSHLILYGEKYILFNDNELKHLARPGLSETRINFEVNSGQWFQNSKYPKFILKIVNQLIHK